MDPTAGKEYMGFVIAANPFAQMIFSPLVGWWSNRLGSIRIPMVFSLLLFMIASAMYSSLELFSSHRKHWMLWSRFLVGVSSANIAVCRSYLSGATRYSERTKAVSMISLAQVLGFIIGPAIQAVVVPLGGEGIWLIKNHLKLNMYTTSGWINVLMSILNIYLFSPSIFKEHRIALEEAILKYGKDNVQDTLDKESTNYFLAWSLITAFFVIVFNFMLMETLATPVTMDQFGWSKTESLWYMGILMSVGAISAVVTFASIAPLTRRYSEVKIMIWGGFFFMVLGRIFFIPFYGKPPKVYDASFKLNLSIYCDMALKNNTFHIDLNALNDTLRTYKLFLPPMAIHNETAVRISTLSCGEDLLGCPSSQEWCSYTPQLELSQFLIGYFLTAFGYPIGVTLIQTIFSKLLGSRPQGVWMGLMTSSGCLSRVMGPVFVTYVYEEYGTIWTFALTTVMMSVSLIWLLSVQKYLNPIESQVATEGDRQELQDISRIISVDLKETVKNH